MTKQEADEELLPFLKRAQNVASDMEVPLSHVIASALRLYLATVVPLEQYLEGPGAGSLQVDRQFQPLPHRGSKTISAKRGETEE